MQEKLRQFKSEIFKALSHPTRIAIVELLRDHGATPVSLLYEKLQLEQANVSQHLAVLRSKQIVVSRKEGNQVFYSLRDRILGKILDLMRDFFNAHLQESLALLESAREHRPRRGKTFSGGKKQ